MTDALPGEDVYTLRHGTAAGLPLLGSIERDAGELFRAVGYRDVPWNAPFYERVGYSIFEPDPSRTGLAAIQEEEARSGYAVKPRVAMRKVLAT